MVVRDSLAPSQSIAHKTQFVGGRSRHKSLIVDRIHSANKHILPLIAEFQNSYVHQDHDLLVCIVPILPIAVLAKLNKLESDFGIWRHDVEVAGEYERKRRFP